MSEPHAGEVAERAAPYAAWQRLDRRMLLVHPVREIVRYIPVLIASVIIGTRNDNPGWGLIALVFIVGFAVARWFTTTYRIGPDNVELRTGVLQRKRLAVPRSRIRSVDIEADPLHRVLGLTVLTIGTGQQAERDEQFKLDALDARLVPGLRAELLKHLKDPASPGGDESRGAAGSAESAPASTDARAEGVEIGHWQRNWVRYAPLSLTGFAIVAPVVGLAFQYGLAEAVFRSDTVHDVQGRGAWFITGVVAILVVAVVAIVSLAGCARYLATYYGLRVLDNGRTLHLRHGLFTTRQTTLDLARLRGATVNEPLLLRLAGGAELEAIMTGTSPRQKILPQAPRASVERTLGHLLASRPNRSHPSGSDAIHPAPTDRADTAERRATTIARTPATQPGSDDPATTESAGPATRSGPADSTGPATDHRPGTITRTPAGQPDPTTEPTAGSGDTTARSGAADSVVAADHGVAAIARTPADQHDSGAPPDAHAESGPTMAHTGPTGAEAHTESSAATDGGGTADRATTAPPGDGAEDTRDAAAPATIPLIAHGPRARRRRWTRALAPVVAAAVALGVASVAGVGIPIWAWVLVVLIALAATALAHDRYRGLGHAVLPATGDRPTWLITRSGSLDRDRDCLEAPGIIGWTVRQTFFQRRAGVATLIAATAAGKKRYRVIDVPVARAWELIEAVTPGQPGHRQPAPSP